MPALLLGSISTVADTSELQRQAFNDAFADHDLGWSWGREEYVGMLADSGGASRIASYAAGREQDVDAAAVHSTKSRRFQENLATADISPRPGVVEAVRAARSSGWKVALVTTTSRANVEALLDALEPQLSADDFDVIVDVDDVDQPKPDPAAYRHALDRLGQDATECVAVEDNVEGVAAASAAGVACVAFPNENTGGQDFSTAERRVERIDYDELRALTARR